ncbi:flavodoxin domain-containing protein [Clostridium gasigenes]|uniref:Flavodoxin domain-containing protein n=1 Tax=Clostridium gasigenes TaxID=94869 RepID=A0A7X0S9S1_9CLOT|nr:flavodoxin domain-containing protein [Clostridium gasigenes]MBB6713668.1 flavodoxin domain-containing protein [Clostridium gasigenes]
MKITIVYGTNYGTSEKVANILKDKLKGKVTLVNIKTSPNVDLSKIDKLIIGGSIKIGQIPKELKRWINNNLSEIIAKKPYLYMCAAEEDEEKLKAIWEMNYPKKILESAVCKTFVGGEMDITKLNFFMKTLLKIVKGKLESSSNLKDDSIENLSNLINSK